MICLHTKVIDKVCDKVLVCKGKLRIFLCLSWSADRFPFSTYISRDSWEPFISAEPPAPQSVTEVPVTIPPKQEANEQVEPTGRI